MTEEWRPVVDFPAYEVSSLGRVRRLTGGQGARALKVLTWHTSTSTGYPTVRMRGNGTSRGLNVHKIVSRAFLGPKPDGLVTRHLDGDKLNNAAGNLAYGTITENNRDKIKHGTSRVGCHLDFASAEEIRRMRAAGDPLKVIAARYGIHFSYVSRVCRGECWPAQESSARAMDRGTA